MIVHAIFVLIVKNIIKTEKLYFASNIYARCEEMSKEKIVCLKKICKLAPDYFFIRVIFFHSFIKDVFMKIKDYIFPPKYTGYG